MNIYSAFLPIIAIASLVMAIPAGQSTVPDISHTAASGNAVLREALLPQRVRLLPQRVTAQLRIIPSAGGFSWPNDGTMPILAYGWGGDRPNPSATAFDSSRVPYPGTSTPPILIVQRRTDNFSPLLQSLLDQNQTVSTMTIVIEPITQPTIAYTMRNVRLLAIRDVGQVIEENPVTEEIVFIFDTISVGRPDEGRE